MPYPMMACGHVANSHRSDTGTPSCVICIGIHPGAETVVPGPDLTDRLARCSSCKRERASDVKLAFFEFTGPGSRAAVERCRCGFTYHAHEKINPLTGRPGPVTDHAFEAHGPYDRDRYYCGCRGWD
jgi:hypothetical protein